jgi:hypothetical protein
MIKYISLLLILTVLTIGMATAVSADNGEDNSQADEQNPTITIVDPVRGIAKAEFIHYDKGQQKNTRTSSPLIGSGSCWSTFATWDSSLPVNYVINPTNGQGLSDVQIGSAISTSAETWDAATGRELFNDVYTFDGSVRYGRFDGKNSIVFGKAKPRIIAVTATWYNTGTGQIYEFDMKFNTYYRWGNVDTNTYPYLMDIQNIATHELGHGVGMDDIYAGGCTDVTMYGYGNFRETYARDLAGADIEGLLSIYP